MTKLSGFERLRGIAAAIFANHPLCRMTRLDEEMGLYDDDASADRSPEGGDGLCPKCGGWPLTAEGERQGWGVVCPHGPSPSSDESAVRDSGDAKDQSHD